MPRTKAGQNLLAQICGIGGDTRHMMGCRWEWQVIATESEAMLRLLDELETGFINNPKHHTAVIHRVREAIEKGEPLPMEAFAARVKAGA